MKKLIKMLKSKIKNCTSDGTSDGDDVVSWGMEEGILISKNQAKEILNALQSKELMHIIRADIRNKLSPIKTLTTFREMSSEDYVKVAHLEKGIVEESKKSIEYLANLPKP